MSMLDAGTRPLALVMELHCHDVSLVQDDFKELLIIMVCVYAWYKLMTNTKAMGSNTASAGYTCRNALCAWLSEGEGAHHDKPKMFHFFISCHFILFYCFSFNSPLAKFNIKVISSMRECICIKLGPNCISWSSSLFDRHV